MSGRCSELVKHSDAGSFNEIKDKTMESSRLCILELQTKVKRRFAKKEFTIKEKAWLKVPSSALTFETLCLRDTAHIVNRHEVGTPT